MADQAPALRDRLAASALASSSAERVQISATELAALTLTTEWMAPYPQVYVGRGGITIPAEKKKLIPWDQWPVPIAELGRTYLKEVWADSGSPRPNQKARGWGWEAPVHVVPTTRSRGLAYIDIDSAYWQILSPFRPDDWPLERGGVVAGTLSWLEPEAVEADRRLRHSIVGSVFADHLTYYRYGEPKTVYAPSRWSNPALKRLTMQTLHAIACQLRRRFGLHAWLTDAAIVDAKAAEDVVDFLACHWGIGARITAMGMGRVWSTQCYIVGDKVTHDFTESRVTPRTAVARERHGLRRAPGNVLRRERLRRL